MLQADTTYHATPPTEHVGETQRETAPSSAKDGQAAPLHPYQVLRELPADATPAQQDSAIQAAFHPENTHLSTRPDTLHLPGHTVGKSVFEVSLPQYYKESFFSDDSLFHPEISGGRYGIAGDPMPYSVRNDNVITGLLLGCFILALVAFSRSRRFIARQAKNFFYVQRSNTSMTETTGEFRFQFFLMFQTCLLQSILAFFYTQQNIADTFILSSQYFLVAIFFGTFAAYYFLKLILYAFVNWIFFDKRRNEQWLKAWLFIVSMEGVAFFPLVMLQSYFDLSMQSCVVYALIVIILVKLFTFYKCFTIFFRRNGGFLQIILYFCALEMTPLLSLWGVLVMTVDYLKINF